MSRKEFRHDLEVIFRAGVRRVDPYELLTDCISLDNSLLSVQTADLDYQTRLDDVEEIIVIGAGKATARMAKAMEEILGSRISQGLISVKYGHSVELSRIETVEAGHPVPDENGLSAALRMEKLLDKTTEKTVVFGLISGGGSALLPYPYRFSNQTTTVELTLREKQDTTRLLLNCGATINELNCVRKHLSGFKGGRLASRIYPAISINFILSDVVGDRLDCVASGPTSHDGSTFQQMYEIFQKYEVMDLCPPAVVEILHLGLRGDIPETPTGGDVVFSETENIVVGTNYLSLVAAADKARSVGYETTILSSQIVGEAREVAKVLCGIAKDTRKRSLREKKPLCVISGGETTVTIRGHGKGGRNQEMALSFLNEMDIDPEGTQGIYFLAASTDGDDGPTDAAGAFASSEILRRSKERLLSITDFLKSNDSYHFFEEAGGLLKTGPTNTNVCDIQIMLVDPDD